jgi:predicted GNAT family N-acyltransferase
MAAIILFAMSAPSIRIDVLPWERAREEASRIRFEVFVREQRVPREIELDAHDAVSLHALAFDSKAGAVGTGRLLPDGHIGRMAVLPPWRGRGVGSALLERLVELARTRGDQAVVLSAQVHAQAFYHAHGFRPEGAVYEEAGIPHLTMRRTL